MLRPFVFIFPSLLVGCVVGIFVGRATIKPAGKPLGQSRPGTSVPQEGSSGSTEQVSCRIDYDRLASACARGASKGALGVTGSVRSSTRGEDEAKGALAGIED